VIPEAAIPVAKRVPHVHERPSGGVVDEWHWLADVDDPDTLTYLRAENDHADAWFAERQELIDAIVEEIRHRTVEDDSSAPVAWGGWMYAVATREGMAYPIHQRWRPDAPGDVHVMLDENVEADGHEYHALGAFEISPSHDRLAWSVDHDGSERYELRIRDLSTGEELPDRIADVAEGAAWSLAGDVLFYTRRDAAMRPFQVWRHRLGTPADVDELVWHDDDERFYVGVSTTRDDRYVVISAGSHTTSEIHVIDAGSPLDAPVVIEPRRHGVEYDIDHRHGQFVIVTNDDAVDFRVVVAPAATPGRTHWRDLVAHRPGVRITAADCFDAFVVVSEWSDAQPQVRLVADDGVSTVLNFDEPVRSVHIGANPDQAASSVRVGFQSMTRPPSTIDVAVRDGEWGDRIVRKQTEVRDHDPERYVSTRVWVDSAGGARVPIDVVRHRDTSLDGTAPICIYGYGAYETSLAPWFSVARLSFLDRGGVFAVAHVRGGGELGRSWYEDGKMANKRNTFLDLIACAEHLVAQKVCAPARIAIRGGSAGGLLVGAAMTMRPELFAAVVAEVPFVDVVTTMSDASLPLTVGEWEEWGNPTEADGERLLTEYAPYENLRAAVRYPALYATAGLNDPRVLFHEPAKFVAKLRALSPETAPVLLRTELGAGHGGPTGRYEEWKDEARTLAFLLAML
jgi:oligopeptidase B